MTSIICNTVAPPTDLESLLRNHGISPTSQRLAIGELLFSSNVHVTADILISQLRERGLLISKATVYNTLGTFVNHGLLKEVFIDASCTYYDSNISCHHHIYNMDSGELSDVNERIHIDFDPSFLGDNCVLEDVELVIRVRNQAPQ